MNDDFVLLYYIKVNDETYLNAKTKLIMTFNPIYTCPPFCIDYKQQIWHKTANNYQLEPNTCLFICVFMFLFNWEMTQAVVEYQGCSLPALFISASILVYVLCNEMVMYVSFPFYWSNLGGRSSWKWIAQVKDEWWSCPITLNVNECLCPHEFSHLYLHDVLFLDGSNN